MSLLVVGASHRSASMDLLERVALGDDAAGELAAAVQTGADVAEVLTVSTCNRLEVYVEATAFHGAVHHIGQSLATTTGVEVAELAPSLYVHYEDRAVGHAFSVAAGLDSMAVGEGQILGQFRTALRRARRSGRAGTHLGSLFDHALRVGRRAHAETEIDAVSRSLVQRGLERAEQLLGPLAGRTVVVVGAGAMSSLAAMTVARRVRTDLHVVNRTRATADRLAEATEGTAHDWDELAAVLAGADVVITCTGATGAVITRDLVAGLPQRERVLVDLALPRDVEPEVADLPGQHVVGLGGLGGEEADAGNDGAEAEVRAVRELVEAEVAAFEVARRQLEVAPTVTALRRSARAVVESEMARLDRRLPDLGEAEREEVSRSVHRIVEKLLHTPSVRVKQLAGDPRGDFAGALRELFDLDPHETQAVSAPPTSGPTPLVPESALDGLTLGALLEQPGTSR
ncbi:glutamyl-tRNA reductase [Kytococcus schroeteri]|uniref:Glutamyl-tRNA reductase n=1 Tax=Kytococcus schroeteri TaxID=138300 RepID=A0A2I1PBY5_9MICO|nr:glutamyl-tRNA reductase [Kytococcus schroeteri]PKZ42143.1 glutamyl-tRNA reductase [Kytococcus schroeteri]